MVVCCLCFCLLLFAFVLCLTRGGILEIYCLGYQSSSFGRLVCVAPYILPDKYFGFIDINIRYAGDFCTCISKTIRPRIKRRVSPQNWLASWNSDLCIGFKILTRAAKSTREMLQILPFNAHSFFSSFKLPMKVNTLVIYLTHLELDGAVEA